MRGPIVNPTAAPRPVRCHKTLSFSVRSGVPRAPKPAPVRRLQCPPPRERQPQPAQHPSPQSLGLGRTRRTYLPPPTYQTRESCSHAHPRPRPWSSTTSRQPSPSCQNPAPPCRGQSRLYLPSVGCTRKRLAHHRRTPQQRFASPKVVGEDPCDLSLPGDDRASVAG